jgi:hypothetical protein
MPIDLSRRRMLVACVSADRGGTRWRVRSGSTLPCPLRVAVVSPAYHLTGSRRSNFRDEHGRQLANLAAGFEHPRRRVRDRVKVTPLRIV